jgi:hypothetical protein
MIAHMPPPSILPPTISLLHRFPAALLEEVAAAAEGAADETAAAFEPAAVVDGWLYRLFWVKNAGTLPTTGSYSLGRVVLS